MQSDRTNIVLVKISHDYESSEVIINNVSSEFRQGEITAIIGPSGCGKTTLLRILANLINPTAGHIEYSENDNSEKLKFGFVFQTPTLIPWKTVLDNALVGAVVNKTLTDATVSEAKTLLNKYGLSGYEDKYPKTLSGGMQQRVAIIRAIIAGCQVLLLDEPFANSDFIQRKELQKQIDILTSSQQLITILVTHDLDEAVRMSDKIYILSDKPSSIIGEILIPEDRSKRIRDEEYMAGIEGKYLKEIYQLYSNKMIANEK